ncbi:TetR/AcrR family transcriptional regulator [Nocardia sp. NPDC051570]|uniref:TetR/AcrR family transcriptional regulator n=1 Tax=Nocardia sp. NPDC051570 TaxID=3364324 RepID=UPI00378BC947
MTRVAESPTARTRLLEAAARLLVESGGAPITTRAICDLAGVQAPTLYHHFGDKRGLLDAVAAHGFEQYLAAKRSREASEDPIDDIRAGWDHHVEFALENPAFYAVMYGQVTPGKRPAAARDGEALLLSLLTRAAKQGRLAVTPEGAARLILATNIGVAMALVTEAPEDRDPTVSERAREAVLASIVRTGSVSTGHGPDTNDVSAAAIALRAALDGGPSDALSSNENALLKDWLLRLAH